MEIQQGNRPCSLVRQYDATRTEYIRLHMHFAPRQFVIVNQADIQLIRASRVVVLRCAPLLKERDLVIDTYSSDERYDEAPNEVLHRR
jgi:hypothetical protein